MNRFKEELKGVLSSKSKLKVALVILGCIVVLGVTMDLLTVMARNELESEALDDTAMQADRINLAANTISIANGWVLKSFLNGFSNCESVVEKDTTWTRHYFTEEQLRGLTPAVIREKLQSFLDYNSEFNSLVMLFEKGVMDGAPDGLAIDVRKNGGAGSDLLGDDVFNKNIYRRAAQSRGLYTNVGFIEEDSIWVWTSAVPLSDTDGKVIGELWGDIPVDVIFDEILHFQNGPETKIGIIDINGRVISTNDPEDRGKMLQDVLRENFTEDIPEQWMEGVLESIHSNRPCRFSSRFGRAIVDTHVFGIRDTQFKLLIMRPEDRIYKDVDRFRLIMAAVAVLCLILVLCCLAYVFFAYNRAYGDKMQLENELKIASRIQQDILPPNPASQSPDFGIYCFQRSAKSVGGDLYDHMVRDGKLFFCLGDVSGKGVAAALLMAEICSLFRFISRKVSDPVTIMKELNGAMVEHDEGNMFCTMFIGVLDLESGHLEFCNAGHNPPVLIHADGEAAYLSLKPNIPLYVFDDFGYSGESLDLKPSDALFLYSDGVTEARSAAGTMFGEAATLAGIRHNAGKSLKTMTDGILGALELFTSGTEQNDDISMMTIRYTRRGNVRQ